LTRAIRTNPVFAGEQDLIWGVLPMPKPVPGGGGNSRARVFTDNPTKISFQAEYESLVGGRVRHDDHPLVGLSRFRPVVGVMSSEERAPLLAGVELGVRFLRYFLRCPSNGPKGGTGSRGGIFGHQRVLFISETPSWDCPTPRITESRFVRKKPAFLRLFYQGHSGRGRVACWSVLAMGEKVRNYCSGATKGEFRRKSHVDCPSKNGWMK